MDWNIQETSAVILGAGFSVAATDGKLPLMGKFFDQLEVSKFPKLHDFVTAVTGCLETANVESVLLTLDQIRTSPDGVLEGWADKWKQNTPAVHRELAGYTLWRMRDLVDIADDNWAASLMEECATSTTVISMNYDNIAERILSNREGLLLIRKQMSERRFRRFSEIVEFTKHWTPDDERP